MKIPGSSSKTAKKILTARPYFFHGDHDSFCWTSETLWETPHCSRDPSPGSSRPPPGLEGPRSRRAQRRSVGSGRCPRGRPTQPPGPPPPAAAPHRPSPALGLREMAEEKEARKHRLPLGTHLPAVPGAAQPGEGGRPTPSPSGAPGSRRRPSTSGSAPTSAAGAPFPGWRDCEVAAAPSRRLGGPPGSSREGAGSEPGKSKCPTERRDLASDRQG